MQGMNLHDIVRGVITTIHPDEPCKLYQAAGQVNHNGVITPKYKKPRRARINIQPLDTDALRHLELIDDTQASEQAFLYSTEAYPVSSVRRIPIARGGDLIQRQNGEWFLVTSVLEDWSQDGWANVGITQQVTPPDFSMSDWYDNA